MQTALGLPKRPGACLQTLAATGGTAESAWRPRLDMQTTVMGAGCELLSAANGCWLLLVRGCWWMACQRVQNGIPPHPPSTPWNYLTCYPVSPPYILCMCTCSDATNPPRTTGCAKLITLWMENPPPVFTSTNTRALHPCDDECPRGRKNECKCEPHGLGRKRHDIRHQTLH